MDPKLLAAAWAIKKEKKDKKKTTKTKTKESSSGSSGFQSFAGSSVAEKRKAEEIEAEKEVAAAAKIKKTEDTVKVIEKREEADWSNCPESLLPYTTFGEEPNLAFVEHFVRFMIGQWREALQNGSSFTTNANVTQAETASFQSEDVLKESEVALAPLLREIRENKGETVTDAGDKDGMVQVAFNNGTSWGKTMVKASEAYCQDNITRHKCNKHIIKMCTLAAEKDYAEANKVYMKLALGNKKWNQTHATFGVFQQNKGARCFKTIQDRPNTYDTDPIAQKYIWAVRKLVHLAQHLRPNEDLSKHMTV